MISHLLRQGRITPLSRSSFQTALGFRAPNDTNGSVASRLVSSDLFLQQFRWGWYTIMISSGISWSGSDREAGPEPRPNTTDTQELEPSLLAAIVKASPDSIVSTDLEGNI